MKRIAFWSIGALALASIVGCESDTTTDTTTGGVQGASTLTAVGALTSADECPNGGVDLKNGIDKNGDGELQDDEVKSTYALCHGESADKETVDDSQESP